MLKKSGERREMLYGFVFIWDNCGRWRKLWFSENLDRTVVVFVHFGSDGPCWLQVALGLFWILLWAYRRGPFNLWDGLDQKGPFHAWTTEKYLNDKIHFFPDKIRSHLAVFRSWTTMFQKENDICTDEDKILVLHINRDESIGLQRQQSFKEQTNNL